MIQQEKQVKVTCVSCRVPGNGRLSGVDLLSLPTSLKTKTHRNQQTSNLNINAVLKLTLGNVLKKSYSNKMLDYSPYDPSSRHTKDLFTQDCCRFNLKNPKP